MKTLQELYQEEQKVSETLRAYNLKIIQATSLSERDTAVKAFLECKLELEEAQRKIQKETEDATRAVEAKIKAKEVPAPAIEVAPTDEKKVSKFSKSKGE